MVLRRRRIGLQELEAKQSRIEAVIRSILFADERTTEYAAVDVFPSDGEVVSGWSDRRAESGWVVVVLH